MGTKGAEQCEVEHLAIVNKTHSHADAVEKDSDGALIFIKPCEVEERMEDVIRYLRDQEASTDWNGMTTDRYQLSFDKCF